MGDKIVVCVKLKLIFGFSSLSLTNQAGISQSYSRFNTKFPLYIIVCKETVSVEAQRESFIHLICLTQTSEACE